MADIEEAKRVLRRALKEGKVCACGSDIPCYIEDEITDALANLDSTEEVPHCTLTYGDGWVFCSNCEGEWVDLPQLLEEYKYCPLCGATVIPAKEPGKEGTWITHYNAANKKSYACSRCNAPETYDTRFCPNCGATMEDLTDEPEKGGVDE